MPRCCLPMLLCLAMLTGLTIYGQSPPPPDAKAILDKTRQVYRNLKSYRFEHELVIEGQKAKEKPAVIDKVFIATISDGVELEEDRHPVPHPNTDRCRLEVKGEETHVILIGGNNQCWLYAPPKKEYMKGTSIVDVAPSVGSAMLLGVHMVPFEVLAPKAIQEVKWSRREKLKQGRVERECNVFDGTLKPPKVIDPDSNTIPRRDDLLLGLDFYLMTLRWSGLVKDHYSSQSADGKNKQPEAPRFTMWIDAETSAVLRIELSGNMNRVTYVMDGKKLKDMTSEPIWIKLTDTFQVADLNPKLADELFRFTPPKDVKEVPNIRTPRGQDKDK